MARTIILVGDLGRHPVPADSFAAQLAEAWAADDQAIEVRACHSLDDVLRGAAKAGGVVLLGGGCDAEADFSQLINMLQDRGIPSLALLREKCIHARRFSFVGSMIESADLEIATVVGLVRGMVHCQTEITRLRTDVMVAERFHAGLQTQMAQLHEELQLAAMVQREHLPREIPSVHGVDLGVLYRPANYVSGDIYDVMRLDEDHIGVFLADAVGHGVPAALLTMIISKSLYTKEIRGTQYRLIDPSEVLERLNTEMIKRKGDSTRFATAVYALVNCRSRMARIAGAGHPPPFIFSPDGQVRNIASEGGLLGVFPDETYPSVEVELGVNDVMVIYSDGFEQAFPTSSEEALGKLPTERYLEVFEQYAAGAPHPADMVDEVARQVESSPGSLHQIDDLTLIGVRTGPLAQIEPRQQPATGSTPRATPSTAA